MSMKKIYSPMSEKYLYLYSENAEITTDTVNNFKFKWSIPSQNITNSEISIKSITSFGSGANTKYIIRTTIGNDNVYDSLFGDPILYISTGLNTDNVINPPIIQINDKSINTLTLKISNSIASANRDNGIPVAVSFVICIQLNDYITEQKEQYHTTNPKQVFDIPNYHR
jgi:hypothetical protein